MFEVTISTLKDYALRRLEHAHALLALAEILEADCAIHNGNESMLRVLAKTHAGYTSDLIKNSFSNLDMLEKQLLQALLSGEE